MTLTRRDAWALAWLTLLWGINWPIMKIGVRDFPPMTFRAISMAGGLLVLAAAIRLQGQDWRVPRAQWREVLWIALFNGTIWYVLSIYGVKLLASGRAAILGYTMPIWAAVIGIGLYGEHPTKRLWIGVAAAVVAVALLLSGEFGAITGRPVGTALMLTAALAWGFGTHLMRRRGTSVPLTVLAFWMLALSLVFSVAVSIVVEHDSWVRAPNASEWGAILFNAVVVFGFCQLAWFRLATILPPVASGLSVMLIPVVGLTAGMLMLGERPAWQDWTALVCILLAMATVLLPSRTAGQRAGQAAPVPSARPD